MRAILTPERPIDATAIETAIAETTQHLADCERRITSLQSARARQHLRGSRQPDKTLAAAHAEAADLRDLIAGYSTMRTEVEGALLKAKAERLGNAIEVEKRRVDEAERALREDREAARIVFTNNGTSIPVRSDARFLSPEANAAHEQQIAAWMATIEDATKQWALLSLELDHVRLRLSELEYGAEDQSEVAA